MQIHNTLPVPLESDEQQALFDWAELQSGKYPELRALYHIPNEGKRSAATGAKLRREGLRSGVPDICLPVARGGYHSLYIEMKRVKGGRMTVDQACWLNMLTKYGNYAVRCNGWEEAKNVILWYLRLGTDN